MTADRRVPGPSDPHHHAPHDHRHDDAELHGTTAGADHHPRDGSGGHAHEPDRASSGHAHGHHHRHEHAHEHWHTHEHVHADGARHAHPHAHGHSHAHDHAHSHGHDHDGEHAHEHGHGGDHAHGHGHDHGDLGVAVARMLAERRALGIALAEFPGGRGAALASALARRLHGRVPVVVVGPGTEPAPDIVLRGAFEDGVDVHHLLHALEGDAVPRDGIVLVRGAAFAHGDPAGLDHRIVALHVASGEDAGPTYAMALKDAALVAVTGVEHAGALGISIDAMVSGLRAGAPGAGVVAVDVRDGAGIERIVEWLVAARALKLAAV